jgi:hypothetical protein
MNPLVLRHQLRLRHLPEDAERVLRQLDAPPHLAAHLLLVHDVAAQLFEGLERLGLADTIDGHAICFGAATHDIGKVRLQAELSGPGQHHEELGALLLLEAGVPAHLARFARTHGAWPGQYDLPIEDLLVVLADTCWKGKRDHALEEQIAVLLSAKTGRDHWEVLLTLDELVEQIASEADERLTWQAQFGLGPSVPFNTADDEAQQRGPTP